MRSSELSRKSSERGSVLAVSAFGMLTFLLAVGLCVDFGHFYVVNAELQNAADASSLAGASALNSSPGGITQATDRAVAVMNNFEFDRTGVTINREDVTFAVNLDGPYVSEEDALSMAKNIRFVNVQIPDKTVGVTFSAISLGSNTIDLSQKAIAGMSQPPNVFCDWIPLSVIDDDVNPMMPGQTYTIRGGPQSQIEPGNRQVLAVLGRGGSDARLNLALGIHECAEPGSTYTKDTKPGVNAGTVRQGLNTRFGDYESGLSPEDAPPDSNVKENITWEQYRNATPGSSNWQDPSAGTGVPNRRVVLIPLVRMSEFDNGRDTVQFYKFAAFFLKTRVDSGSGGDIQAEYIGERLVYGSGGYNPSGGPVAPELALPIIYQ
jgi:Flp pilus assembly protein TadG